MCPNPESGGSTTHAGINFQNCIAVLRIAHMLSNTDFGEYSLGKVVSVRSEAPVDVDDVLVTYSSQRREYIQAKLRVSSGDSAWNVMWQHFYKQYNQSDFNRSDQGDIITLAVQWTTQTNDLENLLIRATTSESYAIWEARLTQQQLKLALSIMSTLNIGEDEMLGVCKHVKIWRLPYDLDPLKSDSIENEVRRLLQGVVFPPESVFSVLLGLVATTASLKTVLTYQVVVGHLKQRGIEVRKIEPRSPSLSVNEESRRRQRLQGLQTQYDLLSERINRLRSALAIETDPDRQFATEKKLESLEGDRSKLSREITEIEQAGHSTQ